MYSLYRAWFGDSATADNYSRFQETLSPPDTVVRVGNEGEHQFIAHKGVLAAHSGYLKALLTSAASTPSSSAVNTSVTSSRGNLPATAVAVTAATDVPGQPTRQPVTSVSVSSIGGEAFAPLLNYMYTGRLDVTLDNVYSVLLATHLLHMPGALEQCRAALLRLRGPPPLPTPIPVPTSTFTSTFTSNSAPSPPATGSILRPIPNRLMIDPATTVCWPPTAPLYPATVSGPGSIAGIPHLSQMQPSLVMQSTVPVVPTSSVQDAQRSNAYSGVVSPKTTLFQIDRNRGLRADTTAKSTENASSSSLPFVAATAAAYSAFSAFSAFTASNAATSTRTPSPCQSISPAPSSSTSRSPGSACQTKQLTEHERGPTDEQEYEHAGSSNNETQHRTSPQIQIQDSALPRNRDKAVERTTTSTSAGENERGKPSKRRGRGSNSVNDGSANVLSVVYDVACCDGPVKFHRVLNENYSSAASCGSSAASQPRSQRQCFESENASSENDENGRPTAVGASSDPIDRGCLDTGNGSGSYTCGYCRHTFKSQYCYRKHTKRHLLPTNRVNDSFGNRQRPDTARNRREVRLLDLNVQYYPCKICGCKFPSYYFVHKHRKLCHANRDERAQSDEANSTTAEDQESTTSTTTNERR
ncbi:uncharacterized protein LOC143422851 [Xylocopa sonorina]|uniref:uncharacterized protein LOC143422851 n=1 Tax=Xylocopa sonorina TaxID=1818115 RepID=UPI00403AF72C